MSIENSEEHPAARRMREQFEAEYGAMSKVMSAILHWSNVVRDFHRDYNHDMEVPVTNADLTTAKNEMLAEILRYGAQPQSPVVTDEMAAAGYNAMRDPATNEAIQRECKTPDGRQLVAKSTTAHQALSQKNDRQR